MMTDYTFSKGFTLLETLVALVITALTSILIMQGLSHALTVRERVLEYTEYQREDALRRGWFSDTVNALAADLPRVERHRFHGTSEGFQGLTLAALQKLRGVPTRIEWRIERDGDVVHLYYRQEDNEWQRSWSWRAEQAEFSYFDPEHGWQSQWPMSVATEAQLPAVVAFSTRWRGRPLTWVAAVKSSREPRASLIPFEQRF